MDLSLIMDFLRVLMSLVLFVVTLCMRGAAEAQIQQRINLPTYLAFGDLYADVGTNNYLLNAGVKATQRDIRSQAHRMLHQWSKHHGYLW